MRNIFYTIGIPSTAVDLSVGFFTQMQCLFSNRFRRIFPVALIKKNKHFMPKFWPKQTTFLHESTFQTLRCNYLIRGPVSVIVINSLTALNHESQNIDFGDCLMVR